jgi:hypothetical protein
MDRVGEQFPDGTVLLLIYNPLHLPETLYQFALNHDPRYAPLLTLLVTSKDATRQEGLLGTIAWDGKTTPNSPDEVFGTLCDGVEGYYLQRHLGSSWLLDGELVRRHGLRYTLSYVTFREGRAEETARLSLSETGGLEVTAADSKPPSLTDFVDSSRTYLEALFAAIDAHVMR